MGETLLYFSFDLSHTTFFDFFWIRTSKCHCLINPSWIFLKIELWVLTYVIWMPVLYNYAILYYSSFMLLAPRGQFPRSNSFTSCNMPQIVPKLCLHLLLDGVLVLKINCAPDMTIWFMPAVALRWLGDNPGLGLVQCNSHHKSDCHVRYAIDVEHLNTIQ